ncbi:hypothetical protein D3C83_00680 [compost metagenome]
MRSSLMQFCSETMNPSGARNGRIISVAHSVSYDFTLMNAMSNGFCFTRPWTSVMCMTLTGTACRSAGVVPESWMPFLRMVSTCSGHGSIKVMS